MRQGRLELPQQHAQPIERTVEPEQVEQPRLPADWITDMLNRQDAVPEHGRAGRGNYIHVSSLVDLCARQYYLARRYQVDRPERITGGHQTTFAIGRALEAHVKRHIMADRSLGGIWGMWACACGHSRGIGLHRTDRTCERCGRPMDRYEEPVLRDEEYRIIGRPDVTLHEGRAFKVVLEIKSMARDRWDRLTAPLADHMLQALMYRWLYQRQGYAVYDHVILLYITKDFRYGSPYKEFHAHADHDHHRLMVDDALALAVQVRDAVQEDRPPPRERCERPDCAAARNCPVASLCFNLD